MDNMKKKIGQGIKDARSSAGISRQKLSDMIIQESDTIKKWESGKNMPGIDKLHDISAKLKEPALQMMGFDDEKLYMSEYPFFFTEEEEQIFWANRKVNPDYTIEAFWLDIVIPGREKKIKEEKKFLSIAEILYSKNEVLRQLSIPPSEYMARVKGRCHLMRNLSFEEEDDSLIIKIGENIVHRVTPKEEEQSLIDFALRVMDELSEKTRTPYSFHEMFLLQNYINEQTGTLVFPPQIIIEPLLHKNIVHFDIPEVYFQNPIKQFASPSKEHYRFKVSIAFNEENPVDSMIEIFYQIQKVLLELAGEFFMYYDPALEAYKDAVQGELLYFFLLLKEEVLCFRKEKK